MVINTSAFSGVLFLGSGDAIAIISFYPISEEKHVQIRSEIARREQQPS